MLSLPVRQDLRQLFMLTIPILITQICQSGLSLVDTLMAGQVSALDLSGVAIGAGLWMPAYLLAIGVLIATTPLLGEAIGQQRPQDIPFITQQSLWLALLTGIVGFLLINQLHYLFDYMGVPGNIQPIAKEFIFGISLGFPAVCIYTSLRCYTESLKQPVVVMVISIIGLLLNIPFNYAFIHGVPSIGLPALGGAGCGYASALTLWVDFLLLMGYLIGSKNPIFAKPRFFHQFSRPSLSQLSNQLRVGIPIGMAIFFEVSAFSLASLIISPFGEIAVASHQVTLTISSQMFMLPFSVSMALTIMVSNRFGAKDYQGLLRIKLLGVMVASGLALMTICLTVIFHQQIPRLFSDNAEVIAQASVLLWFATLYQLFDAWQVNFAGMLRGIQDTTLPMFITLFCYWCVAIPLGTYLVRFVGMGSKGVWIALVMALGLASVLLGARVLQQQKILKQNWNII
ncbi:MULTISPECIES: MATE family efflux transporter [unclassified Moraxella]|uniref:MATE family efflux transporter n=1 Tax=unclassified Moraxella TaxID=2685852 RepID=UPI003AF912F3